MSATFLNQLERNWLSRHVTGATPQMPIGQLRRLYYITYLGGTIPSHMGLADLESQWMNKYIRTAGNTPSSNQNSDLWKNMVSAISKTPSKFLNDNKILFYSNAA
jgi:hypothetical protein